MLIVTRESIEDHTKNIKVHLECTQILDLSLLSAFVGQEKKNKQNFKGEQGYSKALNGFIKWVVDQRSSLPNDIMDLTRLHI